jgi:hypothetical protein
MPGPTSSDGPKMAPGSFASSSAAGPGGSHADHSTWPRRADIGQLGWSDLLPEGSPLPGVPQPRALLRHWHGEDEETAPVLVVAAVPHGCDAPSKVVSQLGSQGKSRPLDRGRHPTRCLSGWPTQSEQVPSTYEVMRPGMPYDGCAWAARDLIGTREAGRGHCSAERTAHLSRCSRDA